MEWIFTEKFKRLTEGQPPFWKRNVQRAKFNCKIIVQLFGSFSRLLLLDVYNQTEARSRNFSLKKRKRPVAVFFSNVAATRRGSYEKSLRGFFYCDAQQQHTPYHYRTMDKMTELLFLWIYIFRSFLTYAWQLALFFFTSKRWLLVLLLWILMHIYILKLRHDFI